MDEKTLRHARELGARAIIEAPHRTIYFQTREAAEAFLLNAAKWKIEDVHYEDVSKEKDKE